MRRFHHTPIFIHKNFPPKNPTCYHIQELPVLSKHLQPVNKLGTPLHDESLRMRLIVRSMTSTTRRRWSPPWFLGSSHPGRSQTGFGWTSLWVRQGRQAKRNICEKRKSSKWLLVGDGLLPMKHMSGFNLLFHRPAVAVDLIQHINYSSTEEDCGVVKVVHEAGKLALVYSCLSITCVLQDQTLPCQGVRASMIKTLFFLSSR